MSSVDSLASSCLYMCVIVLAHVCCRALYVFVWQNTGSKPLLSLSVRSALFGGPYLCNARPIVPAFPLEACSPMLDPRRLRGAIVVVQRGSCSFYSKAMFLQDAGAAAMVVVNDDDGAVPRMPISDSDREAGSVVIAAGGCCSIVTRSHVLTHWEPCGMW